MGGRFSRHCKGQRAAQPAFTTACNADLRKPCSDSCFVDGVDWERSSTPSMPLRGSEACSTVCCVDCVECESNSSSTIAFAPITPSTHEWCSNCTGVERLRRFSALHQVCSGLLSIPPPHRPRKTQSFSRLLRHCVVKTYTVSPFALARALGAPDDIQASLRAYNPAFSVDLIDDVDAVPMHEIRKKWNDLKASGWPEHVPSREVVLWFVRHANVRTAYDVDTLVSVLCDLGLILRSDGSGLDCSRLTSDACQNLLEPVPKAMLEPWSIPTSKAKARQFRMRFPLDLKGRLIGKDGVSIRTLQSDLEVKLDHHVRSRISEEPELAEFPVGKKLRLSISDTHITFAFRKPVHTKGTVDIVAGALRSRLQDLRNAAREQRLARQQRLLQAGLQYHTLLRQEREKRQGSRLDSLQRALAPSAPDLGERGRKGAMCSLARWRRQVDVQHKKHQLLRTCRIVEQAQARHRGAALAKAQHRKLAVTAEEVAGAPHLEGAPSAEMDSHDAVALLLNSAHLVRLCLVNRPRKAVAPHRRGTCKDTLRLQRLLSKASGMSEMVELPVMTRVRHQRKKVAGCAKNERRRERKPKRVGLCDMV